MVVVKEFQKNYMSLELKAILLYGAGMNKKIDDWFQADSSSINKLKDKITNFAMGF